MGCMRERIKNKPSVLRHCHVKNMEQVIKVSRSFILYSNSGWLGLIKADLDDFGGSIYILLFAGVGKDLGCTCHMSMETGRETRHYLGGHS